MRTRFWPIFLLVILTTPAVGQEWARFRGPNGDGIGKASLPTTWTEKDQAWKVATPGIGHSSPIAWGNKLFITSCDRATGQRIVLCYSLDEGKLLWKKETDGGKSPLHQRNSYATSTPVADEKNVYVSWATKDNYTVAAYDHDGKPVWQQDLGPYKSQHGMGVSPIRFDDLVIVANDQDDGGSLVALNSADGKVRWTIPRKPKNATYATPCVFQIGKRAPEIIFANWQHGVTAVDPKAGKVNWEISVFNTKTNERSIASPIVAGDLILTTCGFVTGVKHHVALRVGEDGKPVEAWRLERQVSYMPTPIIKGDRVFLTSEQGWATCLDLQKGTEIWQERIGGGFSASPVAAGDYLYCIANDGVVHVLKMGDKYDRVGKVELGEPTQSTPAIAGGKLIIRTEKSLIAINGSK